MESGQAAANGGNNNENNNNNIGQISMEEGNDRGARQEESEPLLSTNRSTSAGRGASRLARALAASATPNTAVVAENDASENPPQGNEEAKLSSSLGEEKHEITSQESRDSSLEKEASETAQDTAVETEEEEEIEIPPESIETFLDEEGMDSPKETTSETNTSNQPGVFVPYGSQQFRSSQRLPPELAIERLENELELLRASHETALRNGYDVRDEQVRMREINTRTTQQLQNEITSMRASMRAASDVGADRVLPHDSFSFIMVAKTCSIAFNFGLFIYTFQMATFSLVTLDLVSSGDGSTNVFGIPGDVTAQLRASQFIAILVAVFTQNDLMTGFGVFRDGYHNALRRFEHASRWKYVLSLAARLSEGSVGLVVSFLLIITADSVVELLLNFTAIEFVSNLDEVFFFLSRQGFAGKKCKRQAEIILRSKYQAEQRGFRTAKILLLLTILVAMMIGWIFVINLQVTGQYFCNTVQVQFGDDFLPRLGTFSGLYDLSAGNSLFSQRRVAYVERRSTEIGISQARFAYCNDIGAWTFRWDNRSQAESDPCDWVARSSETETFDIVDTSTLLWYVQDSDNREVALDPFYLACFDCSNSAEDCGGHGTCDNAVCQCDRDDRFGLSCEFARPCSTLSVDSSGDEFVSTRDWATSYETFDVDGEMVVAYERPVRIHDNGEGDYDILTYTGRRWGLTSSQTLPLAGENTTKDDLGTYFRTVFHAREPNLTFSFLSEPADFLTPKDASSPVGLRWFRAFANQQNKDIGSLVPDKAVDTVLLCKVCDPVSNPCFHDGICVDGACKCSPGSFGDLCQVPPTGNGNCNLFFNTPEFNFDGGDCCETTCVSTPDFQCGYNTDGSAFIGYRECQLSSEEWNSQGGIIYGDSFSLSGEAIAISRNGRTLVIAEPGANQVRLFDKDGSKWVQRAASLELEISIERMSASSGRGYLLNSPQFLAPIFLAIAGTNNEANSTRSVHTFYCTIQSCEKLVEVPSAYSAGISADGSVIAFAFDDPPRLQISRVDHPTDTRDSVWVDRESFDVLTAADYEPRFEEDNFTSIEVKAIALSANGDKLAVEIEEQLATDVPGQRHKFESVVVVFFWNGVTYLRQKSIALSRSFSFDARNGLETLLRPSFAMSGDGNLIVATATSCTQQAYAWNGTGYEEKGEPIRAASENLASVCHSKDNVFASDLQDYGQSISLSEDGSTVAIGLDHADHDVYAFIWNGTASSWQQVGQTLRSGPRVSTALSANGSTLVVGLPVSRSNDAGSTTVYSRILTPGVDSSEFRVSVTPDTNGTSWDLYSNKSKELILAGDASSPWELASSTVRTFVPLNDCLVFSFYPYTLSCVKNYTSGCTPPPKLSDPVRFDLLWDDVAVSGDIVDTPSNRSGFCEHQNYAPKQVFLGDCSTCPNGMQRLRMMVYTCGPPTKWKLIDNSDSSTLVANSCNQTDPFGEGCLRWESLCIDADRCYTFSVGEKQSSRAKQSNGNGIRSELTPLDYYIFIDGELIESGGAVPDSTDFLYYQEERIGKCNG